MQDEIVDRYSKV